ncbi:hypothetical protein GCM10009535_32170 [Streptomyces thermocarboxydovorans]|uniref:Peptidoglycan binding domain-containing protein n=1 Tax=Streptomyces thermocarboxydovorans TaxID=59298 RepID=A0ABN1HI66_9ACTN
MSRETDTPSSGPSGRGGAAYPSGTPPYGTPTVPEAGTGAGGDAAARSEDRKTETTLTTRVRINIPGSRPIPPVVVRKPVSDVKGKAGAAQSSAPGTGTSSGSGQKAAGGDRPAQPGGPGASGRPAGQAARSREPSAGASSAPAQQPAEGKTTSDWFAPRKPPQSKGGSGATPANGTSTPGGSPGSTGPGGSGGPGGSTGSGAPSAGSSGAKPAGAPGGGRPGGVVGAMSVPGATRSGGTNGSAPGSGLPGATGGPVAPGHGGGTGSFDVTEALGSGPRGGSEPRRDDLPYFTGDRPGGAGDRPGQSGQGPAGPTTGPVTGKGPAVPADGHSEPRSGASEAPGGSAAGLSDDTAVLTPQAPAPEGTPGYPRHDNVSGHTVTSGIPVISPDADFGRAPGTGGAAGGPGPHTPPRLPEPVSPSSANSSQAPKKKGRNKLVLVGGGVVALVGVAYGAGLLMNHSDVPKGTTVLGVDIGGGTRDEAVKKLNDALAERLDKPLKLQVAGKTVELQPDNAGLQLDTDATVEDAAGSDYNPISVIGSLFGNERVVDPVIPVDEEKLQAALEDAAGGAGSMTEGTIKFVSGKAIPVYGKAGQGIDVGRSTAAVEKAFRTQVETGSSAPVAVPTTVRQPTVSKAEVDRMMKEFAEPAMSANVTVQTDPAHSVPMSPEKSLWKFLRVTAVDGKLVEKPDLNALKKLYGGAFDGVLITRANGEKTPVTPQDVYGALREALKSKTNRVAVIDTDPN